MRLAHIKFPCGDITLEGIWHFPDATDGLPSVAVCHPHPLYGGSMSNGTVRAICEALARQGIASLRFNFRGAGGSEGEYGGGIAEQEDAEAALSLIRATPGTDRGRTGLAGYSFGAGVALAAAGQDSGVKLLALVSPALSEPGWEQLKAYKKPVFVISGEYDSFITPGEIGKRLESSGKQFEVIAGADHFWERHEGEVGEKVAGFFAGGFGQA